MSCAGHSLDLGECEQGANFNLARVATAVLRCRDDQTPSWRKLVWFYTVNPVFCCRNIAFTLKTPQ